MHVGCLMRQISSAHAHQIAAPAARLSAPEQLILNSGFRRRQSNVVCRTQDMAWPWLGRRKVADSSKLQRLLEHTQKFASQPGEEFLGRVQQALGAICHGDCGFPIRPLLDGPVLPRLQIASSFLSTLPDTHKSVKSHS